ncbi:MAG: hypothetical protein D6767_08405 [Candidatus Hydrogenedentota bacterium]|nr:MAG: hypothetical protein D6767_08405 [Candidatus Hydrogenedentota bacterium]
MRKLQKTGALLIVMTLVGLIACGGGSKRTMLKGDTEDYQTEGWLDDDTFQVRALGAPNPNAKGFVRRRTQAEEAALLAAQKRVVELLVGAKISAASGSDSGESTGVAITKELDGVVKGGTIVKKTFDSEDNCEITYRIHAKGLKKMAQALASKKDFR